MRKQGLSRRERNMVEEAVTQVCWAMGVSPRDGELRQTAWAEILSVYREDPAGFRGSGMRGWRLACDLAGEAVWKEEPVDVNSAVFCVIANIRQKLRKVTTKEYIQTVWGVGYKFVDVPGE